MGFLLGLALLIGMPALAVQHQWTANQVYSSSLAYLMAGSVLALLFPRTVGVTSTAAMGGALIAAVICSFTGQADVGVALFVNAIVFMVLGWVAGFRLRGSRELDVAVPVALRRTSDPILQQKPLLKASGEFFPIFAPDLGGPALFLAFPGALVVRSIRGPEIKFLWQGQGCNVKDWDLRGETIEVSLSSNMGGLATIHCGDPREWTDLFRRMGVPRKEDQIPSTTRQAVAGEFGRNAPCWCGSGKKVKRCHGGEEFVAHQSGEHGQVKAEEEWSALDLHLAATRHYGTAEAIEPSTSHDHDADDGGATRNR